MTIGKPVFPFHVTFDGDRVFVGGRGHRTEILTREQAERLARELTKGENQ